MLRTMTAKSSLLDCSWKSWVNTSCGHCRPSDYSARCASPFAFTLVAFQAFLSSQRCQCKDASGS